MNDQGGKPTVLIICDYYLPGFESGGAMRTLVNMVDRLSHSFDFRVVTRDHDGPHGRTPYQGVSIDNWNRIGETDVYYLSKSNIGARMLRKLIEEVDPDVIYLNSFFSPLTIFLLILKKLKRIRPIPVVLAPEGEFSPGALSLKPLKKKLYVWTAKSLRILRDITWKAASDSEYADIERVVGKAGPIFIAPNMPPQVMSADRDHSEKPVKNAGEVKLVFLSRYMRKKNLNWILAILKEIKGDVSLDIYGPIEDADYWEEARRIIDTLPPNIKVVAKGAVSHDQVSTVLAKYHFFILPTLGENFGHVFIEALAAGCPMVISDRTPWRGLEEKGIGWDIPLEDASKWIEVIGRCVDMHGDDYLKQSESARKFAVAWLSDPALETANREVLEVAVISGLRK